MVVRSERRQRGWSLTRRLVVALTAGAFFVALVAGFLGADRDASRRAEDAAASQLALATSLAERGGPWLDRGDVMRLSVLAAVIRDQAEGRAMVLDRTGRVVIDTALVAGDRQLGLLASSGAFQRPLPHPDDVPGRETLVPIRFGGDVVGEVRLQCGPLAVNAAFDGAWFGLVFLACLTLVLAAAMLGSHWSSRVRGATDAVIRLAAGEVAGTAAAGAATEGELQDLGSALQELERGLQEGLHRVGEGYVAMAMQLVDGLERRRLVPPGHGERVARLGKRLADRLQLLPADRDELDLASRLIDLGKAWVRPSILQQQGPLSELERQSLQHHPVRAAEQLECVPGLRRVGKIVRHQLERFDGKGLPDGLRGERIPLGARVLAIAAAFDLLTCAGERPLSWADALACLEKARGEVFDPWLVDLFAADVRQDPPALAPDREVMIVPGGAMPWRATAAPEADDDGDDDAAPPELEVMADEPDAEDRA
jgi:HD-GYP domain-containing protein (c-di-GMP phosphodiesterase class II)